MDANVAGLLGLLIGLLGVLAGLVATVVGVAVAVLIQWREDQRAHTAERWDQATARRERLRAEFERVLSAAYSFQAITSPFVWVNPKTLPEGAYKTRLTKFVAKAYEDLRLADVRLRLEGATEVVGKVEELAREFGQFQDGLGSRSRDSDATVTALREHQEKINELVAPLDAKLQRHLDALTPPDPLPGPPGFHKWIQDVLDWFRR